MTRLCCCGRSLIEGEQKFFHGPRIDEGVTDCPNHEYGYPVDQNQVGVDVKRRKP